LVIYCTPITLHSIKDIKVNYATWILNDHIYLIINLLFQYIKLFFGDCVCGYLVGGSQRLAVTLVGHANANIHAPINTRMSPVNWALPANPNSYLLSMVAAQTAANKKGKCYGILALDMDMKPKVQ
jgi:hypothetical protein